MDRNLFGLGYQGVLRFALGAETQNFRLGFTDPYFLGYPYSAGIDLYHERVEIFDTYSYQITGGDIRVGKELTDKIRLDGVYKLETINIYDVSLDASTYIKEQRGKTTTSAISLTPSMDTRDDYYNPRRGAKHNLLIQNAGGILGGDNYFVKVLGQTSWFFPLPFNTTLNLRGQAGAIFPYGGKIQETVFDPIRREFTTVDKERLPIYERFFMGGIQTVRGFEYGKAGPVDINDEPIGAKYMVVFNAEWIFTLSREIGLRGALFFDVGKAWGVEDRPGVNRNRGIKMGAGPGIRWFSPFGPIHIDLGFNLNPRKGEKAHVIDFTAGSVF
jgi:outer membrane protein insertion porin family